MVNVFHFYFSLQDEASDVAVSETIGSDQPPTDCEEERNPYDSERWAVLKILTLYNFRIFVNLTLIAWMRS